MARPDLHHPNFTVDEGCIPIGLKVLAELATSEAPASERESRCDGARPDVREVSIQPRPVDEIDWKAPKQRRAR